MEARQLELARMHSYRRKEKEKMREIEGEKERGRQGEKEGMRKRTRFSISWCWTPWSRTGTWSTGWPRSTRCCVPSGIGRWRRARSGSPGRCWRCSGCFSTWRGKEQKNKTWPQMIIYTLYRNDSEKNTREMFPLKACLFLMSMFIFEEKASPFSQRHFPLPTNHLPTRENEWPCDLSKVLHHMVTQSEERSICPLHLNLRHFVLLWWTWETEYAPPTQKQQPITLS